MLRVRTEKSIIMSCKSEVENVGYARLNILISGGQKKYKTLVIRKDVQFRDLSRPGRISREENVVHRCFALTPRKSAGEASEETFPSFARKYCPALIEKLGSRYKAGRLGKSLSSPA